MLLSEPRKTQADIHFSLLGIPVRISALFWPVTFFLGFNGFSSVKMWMPAWQAALIWIAAVFVSILLHEFGHALAMRYYGIRSYVVLYHFGGLAVPESTFSVRNRNSEAPKSQIIISAAGPAVQLLLAAIILVALYANGYRAVAAEYYPRSFIETIETWFHLPIGTPIENKKVYLIVEYILYVNIFWALLNLMPIYPLDGGQIARELFLLNDVRGGIRKSLILSIVCGIGIAIWGAMSDNILLAIMFGMFAFSNYQTLQAYQNRGGQNW